MKKIIFLQIILLILTVNFYSQVKVSFKLSNPVTVGNIMSFDVIATIPTGQQWRVGPTCLRVNYWTTPTPGHVTVHEDNPALNANVNISNNSSYGNMTTTEIMNDSSISLNILQYSYDHSCYYFTSGNTYVVGSVRFDILNTDGCVNTSILPISAVFDSATALGYSTNWSKTDTGCFPIGIDLHQINKVPSNFKLYQNYPNPFNPVTKIKFEIPKSSNVKIEIFDEVGRLVETVTNSNLTPGTYETSWDASKYSSGLYFYRLTAGSFVQTLKMMVIK
jgi:hypothetical protein